MYEYMQVVSITIQQKRILFVSLSRPAYITTYHSTRTPPSLPHAGMIGAFVPNQIFGPGNRTRSMHRPADASCDRSGRDSLLNRVHNCAAALQTFQYSPILSSDFA